MDTASKSISFEHRNDEIDVMLWCDTDTDQWRTVRGEAALVREKDHCKVQISKRPPMAY